MITLTGRFLRFLETFLTKNNSFVEVITRIIAGVRIISVPFSLMCISASVNFFSIFMHFSTVFIVADSLSIEKGEKILSLFYLLLFVLSVFCGICLVLFAVLPGKRHFLSLMFIVDLIFDIICIIWSLIKGTVAVTKILAIVIALISIILVLVKLKIDKTSDGSMS